MRELSDLDVWTQAENYLAYEGKHNVLDRQAIFDRWCASKDFDTADRAAIAGALRNYGVKVRSVA